MEKIIITGASGFVGRHLVSALMNIDGFNVHAVVHRSNWEATPKIPRLRIHRRDLSRPSCWEGLIEPGCQLVNLAYFRHLTSSDNIRVMQGLTEACGRHGVKRLIHCSSAVIVGKVPGDVITEETRCRPVTSYEKTKWVIENLLLQRPPHDLETVILRPTAVFGTGGRNLVGLIGDLLSRSRFYNYLKSCLYHRRAMNLVAVNTLVEAIAFFVKSPRAFDREVFIVSEDECPQNNFRGVELQLMAGLKIPDYRLKRVGFPPQVLAALLRLTGRSNTNPQRRYSCDKLLRLGFRKRTSFGAALAAYARTYARPEFT